MHIEHIEFYAAKILPDFRTWQWCREKKSDICGNTEEYRNKITE